MTVPGPHDDGRPGADRSGVRDQDPARDRDGGRNQHTAQDRHRAEEKRTERQMWWYLAYFLFGIHLVALIMIFAVRHAH